MKAYEKIRSAMRRNEHEVLQYIRKYGKISYLLVNMSWMKAIDRLEDAGKIHYSKKDFGYVARPRVRPVTK